jgi:dTDP-4-dehydrorhamnose reductase
VSDLRVLVTGCAGMLGWSICESLQRDMAVTGIYHETPPPPSLQETYQSDVRDELRVKRLMERLRPDVIIHCAGLINVDAAEEDFMATRDVNALGTWYLAKHAPAEAKFIYISTDAVFGGRRGNYTETDLPSPLNAYAKTKLEGEWFVQQERENHLILRTNFFGRHHTSKTSFAEWIVGSLAEDNALRMVTDWYFTPAYVDDLVDAIRGLIAADATGIYNVAGGERCSKYEFGVEVARVFGFNESLVTPVHFDQLILRAPRPQDMTLDCSKVAGVLGHPMPSYKDGLRRFHEAWMANEGGAK